MEERRKKIDIWIHHAAVFAGVAFGIYGLKREPLSRARKWGLAVFLTGQIWALAKIAGDWGRGGSRLERAFADIHKLSRDRGQEQLLRRSFLAGSVLYKVGVPFLLGR